MPFTPCNDFKETNRFNPNAADLPVIGTGRGASGALLPVLSSSFQHFSALQPYWIAVVIQGYIT